MGHRRVALLVAVALTLSVLFGVGANPASAASRDDASPVTQLSRSTQWAVTNLRHAPHGVRLAVARLIVAQARFLLTHPADGDAREATTGDGAVRPIVFSPVQVLAAAVPGTVVGGLFLDGYCQSLGLDHSTVNGPIVAVGAAYQWFCVSGTGARTPIVMQSACSAQYPGTITVAYPQDVNNAYSWVCISPVTGTSSNGTNTVYSFQSPTGAVVLIVGNDGSALLIFDSSTTNGSVLIDTTGNGYMACCSGGGSTLPV